MPRCKLSKEDYPEYIQRGHTMCTPITERGKIYQTIGYKGHVYIIYHSKLRKICCNGSIFKWKAWNVVTNV